MPRHMVYKICEPPEFKNDDADVELAIGCVDLPSYPGGPYVILTLDDRAGAGKRELCLTVGQASAMINDLIKVVESLQ